MSSTGRNVILADDTQLGQRIRIGRHVIFHPGVTVGDDCTAIDSDIRAQVLAHLKLDQPGEAVA